MTKQIVRRSYLRFSLSLLLTLLIPPQAGAQTFPEPLREHLLNGLTVLLWQRPGDAKVLLKLRVHAGAAFDLTGKGGTMALLDDGTRTRLSALAASGTVVALLTASLPVLQRRVGDGARRPLLTGDVRGRLASLAQERADLFAEVATLTVHTDGLDRQQVAARIARAVRARAPKADHE